MNTATNYDLKIKKRIQLVHIAASELGLLDPKRHNTDPDDDYHRVLAQWNRQGTRQPVTSSKQMTYEQLGELLNYFKGAGFKLRRRDPSPSPSPARGEGLADKDKSIERIPQQHNSRTWQKYDSSIQGLRIEICDLARARFGEDYERPLNALCQKFGVRHWKWLDVAHGKEVKNTIIRLNAQDQKPFVPEPEDSEVPF